MSESTPVSNRPRRTVGHMAEPIALRGSDLDRFAQLHALHTSDIGLALGVNTSGLYSKKNSEERLSSPISILLRLYSAFPELMPRITPPDVEVLVAKISSIDPTFKKSHLGPLLGLETNSSFRLKNTGITKASQTARNLLYLIDRIITDDPSQWATIKSIVEIEAESRMISPPESVWARGGWTRALKGLPPRRGAGKKGPENQDEPLAPAETAPPASTAKRLIRRSPQKKGSQ